MYAFCMQDSLWNVSFPPPPTEHDGLCQPMRTLHSAFVITFTVMGSVMKAAAQDVLCATAVGIGEPKGHLSALNSDWVQLIKLSPRPAKGLQEHIRGEYGECFLLVGEHDHQ